MKLLLFDIDGTLLMTNGVGRRALEAALGEACGRLVSTEGVSFSGRTDPAIVAEALRRNGFGEQEARALLPAVFAAYTEYLHAELRAEDVEVLPGVAVLLRRLAAEAGVALGLLTGNLEATAHLKLDRAGLGGVFGFGAFGSDHADRNALGPVALARAAAATGRRFAASDVVVIGDTEHDIACSRAFGARAVAVCTGRFARQDLAAHAPDHLLDDLSDTDGFVEMVMG